MTDANKDLRELLAKATRGPWTVDKRSTLWGSCPVEGTNEHFVASVKCGIDREDDDNGENDAALIAALRNAAPALLDIVDAAQSYYEKRGTFMSDGENHALGEALRKLTGRAT